MGKTRKIPPYQEKTRARNVVGKEFNELERQRESAERKKRKWKRRYGEQEVQLRKIRRTLQREREDAQRERLMAKIRTRLDDWAFYLGNVDEGGER